jgi:hypothetical protein
MALAAVTAWTVTPPVQDFPVFPTIRHVDIFKRPSGHQAFRPFTPSSAFTRW